MQYTFHNSHSTLRSKKIIVIGLLNLCLLISLKVHSQTIVPSATVLNGFSANEGSVSTTQSVDITSTGLTENITVTVPANFEISVDGGATFVTNTTTTVTNINTTVAIQVRVAAASVRGMRVERLALASTGVTTNIRLKSVVVPAYTSTLVSQLPKDANVAGITSQNFTDLGGIVFTADDFTVPAGENWKIWEIGTVGSKGADPINQILVRIWSSNGVTGLPDGVFYEETLTAVNGQNDPNLTLSLSAPLAIPAGTYWLSVTPILDFDGGSGRWFWERTTNGTGTEFHLWDQNNIFGSGFTNWTPGSNVASGDKQLTFNLAGTNDAIAPTVTSINRKTPTGSPTNADVVTFEVVFNEAVTAIDDADFEVTGPTGAAINVTGSGTTYEVAVSGGDIAGLNGTVTLSFNGSQNITDIAGNALANTTPTGTNVNTYGLDNTAPTVVSFTRKTPANQVTSADAITFLATFGEDVTGVGLSDFEAVGPTGATITVTQLTASTYDVVVSGGDLATLNGTLGLNFATGVAITDLAGNTLPSNEPGTDETYTLCNGPNDPVTGIMLGTATINSIVFTGFTAPAGGAVGYVVKINNTNTFTTPTDGTLPTASLTWVGAGEQVIYAGTSTNPSITVTGLNSGITYYFKVFAYSDCGGTNTFESTGGEANTATSKADQTINFILGTDATKTFGDTPFNLNATASSGLAVTYTSSNPAVATVSGSTVTIVGAGTTNITASQAGNANYNAAPDVTHALVVDKGDQMITFESLAAKKIGDAAFDLTASASSGLTVTYTSSNPAVATISGSTVTIIGVGTISITASQAGNSNYNVAPNISQRFEVTPAVTGIGKVGVFVPNIFTPNGDGNNDYFKVISSFQLQRVSFKVFDKYRLVYSTNNVEEALNQGWDGANATAKIYVYEVSYLTTTGKEGVLRGVVKLAR
ncbi:hypothetical protein BKI52_25280 [marine bacterium AO1-C]|nr:hypothetical protein BKI52_25280 [marine bacterium AO1-C]